MDIANKNWKDALISPSSTIKSAIQNLNDTTLKIAIVVGEFNKLLGTVTDGDIRRAIINGINLNDSVVKIMFKDPIKVSTDMGRDFIIDLMRINKIFQLPIVDFNNNVVGLHSWGDVINISSKDRVFVIMAGGFGKRLRPHTEKCPKPMLQVAGKPLLEHIINRAKKEGFYNFIIATHYLGQIIENYFSDGDKLGVNISYLKETTPLGTAGALSLMNPKANKSFIVTNGDVLTDIRYSDLLNYHLEHTAAATMAVHQHEWQHQFGVVKVKGLDITGFLEKPIHRTYINAGVYALSPIAFSYLNKSSSCSMPELFEEMKKNSNKTIVYPMHEPWLDVGRPRDLQFARETIEQY